MGNNRVGGIESPDLFDWNDGLYENLGENNTVEVTPVDYGGMPDEELIAALGHSKRKAGVAICSEIASRNLDSAGPELLSFWRRFTGYGHKKPLPEQMAVIHTIAAIDGPNSRECLKAMMLEDVPDSMLHHILRAAVEQNTGFANDTILPLLTHELRDVRACAYQLAGASRLHGKDLIDGLADQSRDVKLAAAIALGNRGRHEAKRVLLSELKYNPTTQIIYALQPIEDHEVVVLLGRCADTHEEHKATIVDVLKNMESPIAAKRARMLEGSD